MKSFSAAILAATLFISACGGDQPAAVSEDSVDTSAVLATLFDEHFERNLELNPLSATAIGDDRYDDRMALSNSQEYRDADSGLSSRLARNRM